MNATSSRQLAQPASASAIPRCRPVPLPQHGTYLVSCHIYSIRMLLLLPQVFLCPIRTILPLPLRRPWQTRNTCTARDKATNFPRLLAFEFQEVLEYPSAQETLRFRQTPDFL